MKRTHSEACPSDERASAPSAPQSRLYTDALHCIFARVCDADLHLVGRVSRQWRCALSTVRVRTMRISKVTDDTITDMVRSPFRRHVCELVQDNPDVVWSAASLQLVRLTMSHVTFMEFFVGSRIKHVSLPASLFEVCMGGRERMDERALRHIAADAPSLARVSVAHLTAADVKWMARCENVMDVSAIDVESLECFDALRRIPKLEYVGIDTWPAGGLHRFMHGHAWSHLRTLVIGKDSVPFDAACAASLSHAPTLTKLVCHAGVTASGPELARMFAALPRLVSLTLRFGPYGPLASPRAVMDAVPAWLVEFDITHRFVSDDSLAALAGRTCLRTLRVRGASKLETLRGVGDMANLEVLEFHQCLSIRPSELRQLRRLHRLERLEFRAGSAAKMDELTRMTLTPGDADFPSRDWPLLRTVVFE
jgi:hypothetical protein